MAYEGNSCRRWYDIKQKKNGEPSKESCFKPLTVNCGAYHLVEVVEREPKVVKEFLEPESILRRQIDVQTECTRCFRAAKTQEKECTFAELQLDNHGQNMCSAKCKTFGIGRKYKEITKSPQWRPTHKRAVFLSKNTAVGRVFPMKFRLRRIKTNCNNCKRDVYLKETVADSSDIILLSDCCNIEVYPEKKIDNWHLVTVGTITGDKKFSKKVLSETCELERKEIPQPEVKEKRKTVFKASKKKKNKKKKKGKKDKKGKKK